MAQLRTWTSADMHIESHLCNSIDGRYMQLASLLSFEQLICTISRDISARLNGSLLYARSVEVFQLVWRGVHGIAKMLQCQSSWLDREYARLGELFQLAW